MLLMHGSVLPTENSKSNREKNEVKGTCNTGVVAGAALSDVTWVAQILFQIKKR